MDINWKFSNKPSNLPLIPLSALSKIGDDLKVATDDIIQYQISREHKVNDVIIHKFYFLVPLLQDFKFLAVQTSASVIGYPVRVYDFLNGKAKPNDAFFNKNYLIADNPAELTTMLKEIFESDQTSLVIGSLLAEVEAQSKLKIDFLGDMRPN